MLPYIEIKDRAPKKSIYLEVMLPKPWKDIFQTGKCSSHQALFPR